MTSGMSPRRLTITLRPDIWAELDRLRWEARAPSISALIDALLRRALGLDKEQGRKGK